LGGCSLISDLAFPSKASGKDGIAEVLQKKAIVFLDVLGYINPWQRT
jgi:hypothetical protein